MKAVFGNQASAWLLDQALGLDEADRSPYSSADFPSLVVFSFAAIPNTAAIGPGNRVDMINVARAFRAGNSNLCHITVNATTEFALFTNFDQANAAFSPSSLNPIVWTKVAREQVTAIGFFGAGMVAGYGTINDANLRARMNLGAPVAGYPDISPTWEDLLNDSFVEVDFGGYSLAIANISNAMFSMNSAEGTVRVGARAVERASSNFFTYIKAVGLDATTVNSAIVDDLLNPTAAVEPSALTTGDKTSATMSLTLVEVMEDAAHLPVRVICGRAIIDDVKGMVDAEAPKMVMPSGSTAHLGTLVPAHFDIRMRQSLRTMGQTRWTHHAEQVYETIATRNARPVVTPIPPMTVPEWNKVSQVALAYFQATSQDKASLDHGETPTPAARGHRLAKWLSTQSVQTVATTTAITNAGGRATRAVTHETRQLANFAVYSMPHPFTTNLLFFPKTYITFSWCFLFYDLFHWDITVFNGNVEDAYACWNMWAQQYLTLLSTVDFHSRGQGPCLRKGLLALPTIKELPTAYRPYTVLFNRTVSAISELYTTPSCINTTRFRTFLPTIQTTVFKPMALPPTGCLP